MTVKTIHKKYSLEPFKSRVPGRVEYIGADGNPVDPCEAAQGDLGNYGYIPFDVEIPSSIAGHVTDFTDTDILLWLPDELRDAERSYYRFTAVSDISDVEEVAQDEMLVVCNNVEMDTEVIYGKAMIDGQTENVLYKTIYEYNEDDDEYVPHKFLTYWTLKRWFMFFLDYYKGLEATRCDHTQRYDSYYEMCEAVDGMEYSNYRYLDKLFEARGGADMYKWMATYCFGRFKTEGTTLWEYMYYPEIMREYSWFRMRISKYGSLSGPAACKDREDCCDCQEWFEKGGMAFYHWLNSVVSNYGDDMVSETHEAELNIPLLITAKADDLGAYHAFSTDFDVNTDYTATITNSQRINNVDGKTVTGSTCVFYKNEPYLLKDNRSDGSNYSTVYKERMFGNLNPDKFNESKWDYDEYTSDGMKQWDKLINKTTRRVTITGTCDSKISGLEDDVKSFDTTSKVLPFSFRKKNNGTYAYPFEGGLMDLNYHPGNVCLLGRTDDNTDESHKVYSGNVLVFIEYSREGATTLVDTQTGLYNKETGNIVSRATLEDMMKYGCTVKIGYFVGSQNMTGSTYSQIKPVGYSYWNTNLPLNNILYVDTYTLELRKHPYYLTDKTSFNVRFPQLTKAGETVFTYIAMDADGMYMVPVIRRDDYLGISDVEKVDADIYIDRGVNAAYEKHYKLGEIRGTDEFSTYGNGAFNIINLKEE